MLVKLTESGLNLFGLGGDQAVKNFHNDRAYHLMSQGHANKDSRFMAMYEANRAEEVEAVEEKPKPEPKPAPKKEKATSKRAEARETAIEK